MALTVDALHMSGPPSCRADRSRPEMQFILKPRQLSDQAPAREFVELRTTQRTHPARRAR